MYSEYTYRQSSHDMHILQLQNQNMCSRYTFLIKRTMAIIKLHSSVVNVINNLQRQAHSKICTVTKKSINKKLPTHTCTSFDIIGQKGKSNVIQELKNCAGEDLATNMSAKHKQTDGVTTPSAILIELSSCSTKASLSWCCFVAFR